MSQSKAIRAYITELKAEGWCLIEGVIPEDRIDYLREHVVQGHEKAIRDYETSGGSLAFQADANGNPIWHSTASNPSISPRVTMLTRYSPWWISLEFGGRNRSIVPRDVFENFPDAVKDLYRHRAEDAENPIRKH